MVFALTILAMLGVSVYCLVEGNIMTLLAPTDGETPQNICGLNEAQDYPYLFFTDDGAQDLSSLFNSAICVKKCPTKEDTTQCFKFQGTDVCPPATYSSKLVGLYCFPTSVNENFEKRWDEFMATDAGKFI